MRPITLSVLTLSCAALAAVSVSVATTGRNTAPPAAVALQEKPIIISGTVVAVDGSPAAKMPVYLKKSNLGGSSGAPSGGGSSEAPKLLTAQLDGLYKTIAKTTTDDSGKFTIRGVREKGSMRLMVGDKMKTEWQYQTVKNEGKDVDVGKVQLRPSLGGGSNDNGGDGDSRR